MTTSPLPGEFEFSDDDLAALLGCVERVSDPGELIAAIPALLGFHPSNSVVALSLMGASASTLGPVMRHDYFPSVRGKPARQMSAALRQFAAVCDGEGARAVVLVVITDCSAAETLIDETIELAEVFEDMLGGTCVELADVLCTAAIESGQPWTSVMRSIHRGACQTRHLRRLQQHRCWAGGSFAVRVRNWSGGYTAPLAITTRLPD